MRLFHLRRLIDDSGVSGTGIVAEGCEFDDGWCAMRWLTVHRSTTIYQSIKDVQLIHGHGGHTVLEWEQVTETRRFL